MTGASPFRSWNGVELFEFVDGVRLHAIGGEQVLLCRVVYEPGKRVPLHSHEHTEQVMLILDGEVEVNGRLVAKLPAFADPEIDRITVQGRPIKRRSRKIYVMLNKPTNTVTTTAVTAAIFGSFPVNFQDRPNAARHKGTNVAVAVKMSKRLLAMKNTASGPISISIRTSGLRGSLWAA